MAATILGTIRGRTIELIKETDFPSGSKVCITIQSAEEAAEIPANASEPRSDRRAAVLESAGSWSDAEATEFLNWEAATRASRIAAHRDEVLSGVRP